MGIMKAFNLGSCCSVFSKLTQYSQAASGLTPFTHIPDDWHKSVLENLTHALVFANVLELVETRAAIDRLKNNFQRPPSYGQLHYGIHHLLQLMQSEMERRKVLAIEPEKTKYYRDESYGMQPPLFRGVENALYQSPEPLFGDIAEEAFPSAYMDIVEGGRCLALGRNNAAIHHLMNVAEIGLRALAWDRRVIARQYKKPVPIEFAQWGELIGGVEKKVEEIKKWKSKPLGAEAQRFYNAALVEVRSFNDGWRRHSSHARTYVYQPDETIAMFGHVQRFLGKLSERISETTRTPIVWRKPKV
jgi:hypothetical protein